MRHAFAIPKHPREDNKGTRIKAPSTRFCVPHKVWQLAVAIPSRDYRIVRPYCPGEDFSGDLRGCSHGKSINKAPVLPDTARTSLYGVPFSDEDSICPLCHAVQDRFMDHGLVCGCGGDRTKRHNCLRNETYHFAASAGLNPELEKPGRLPQGKPTFGDLPMYLSRGGSRVTRRMGFRRHQRVSPELPD